jgi:hypothetical protein
MRGMRGNVYWAMIIVFSPPPPAAEFKTIQINYGDKSMSGKIFADITNESGISPLGTKMKVFDRLQDLEHMVRINGNSFEYCCKVVVVETVPTWIILNPEPVPEVEGMDMATGAQKGFFGQTNKENAVRGVRHNILTCESERIKRLLLARRCKKQKEMLKKSLPHE